MADGKVAKVEPEGRDGVVGLKAEVFFGKKEWFRRFVRGKVTFEDKYVRIVVKNGEGEVVIPQDNVLGVKFGDVGLSEEQ